MFEAIGGKAYSGHMVHAPNRLLANYDYTTSTSVVESIWRDYFMSLWIYGRNNMTEGGPTIEEEPRLQLARSYDLLRGAGC